MGRGIIEMKIDIHKPYSAVEIKQGQRKSQKKENKKKNIGQVILDEFNPLKSGIMYAIKLLTLQVVANLPNKELYEFNLDIIKQLEQRLEKN